MLYSIPENYYLPKKNENTSSSTVGAFSPEAALQGKDGFKTRMIPASQEESRQCKTLIINYFPDEMEYYKVIAHLLNRGFPIVIMQGTDLKPHYLKLKLSEEEKNQGDYLSLESLTTGVQGVQHARLIEILVKHSILNKHPLRADHIVVCDYQNIEELSNILIHEKELIELSHEDVFNKWFIDYWLKYEKLPQGETYPQILLNEDSLSNLGEQGLELLLNSTHKIEIDHDTALDYPELLQRAQVYHYYHDPAKPNEYGLQTLPLQVKQLYLRPCGQTRAFDSSDFQFITQFNNVDMLSLTSFDLTNNLMIDWSCVKNINTLSLRECKVSLGVLLEILSQSKIEHLILHMIELNDDLLPNTTLPHTKSITIKKGVFPDIYRLLERMTHIEKLEMEDCELTSLLVNSLHTTHLKDLSLLDLTHSSQNLLNLLVKCTQIESLSINSCIMNDKVFDSIFHIRDQIRSESLKSLTVKAADVEMQRFINELLSRTPRLQVFDYEDNDSDFVACLLFTEFSGENLRFLSISGTLSSHASQQLNRIVNNAKNLYDCRLDLRNSSRFLLKWNLNILDSLEVFHYKMNSASKNGPLWLDFMTKLKYKAPRLHSLSLEETPLLCIINDSRNFIEPNALSVLELKVYTTNDSLVALNGLFRPRLKIEYSFDSTISGRFIPEPTLRFLEICTNSFSKVRLDLDDIRYTTSLRYIYFRGLELTTAEWPRNEVLDKVVLDNCRINSQNILNILKNSPNVSTLSMPHSFASPDNLEILKNGNFRYKKQLIKHQKQIMQKEFFNHSDTNQIREVTAHLPQDKEIGDKLQNFIYDEEVPFSSSTRQFKSTEGQVFNLNPLFERIQGEDLNLSHVRSHIYKPVFDFTNKTITNVEILPQLIEYKVGPTGKVAPTLYKKRLHRLTVQTPTTTFTRPWIKLTGLKTHDQLTSLFVENLTLNLDYKVFRATQDTGGFFYLYFYTVNAGTSISLEYTLEPDFKICKIFPSVIADLIEPFERLYQSPPPAQFHALSLLDQIKYICSHPEHFNCEQRSHAVLYLAEQEVKKSIIRDVRCAKAGLHAWVEIKYQGEWYTVDLGGAPATLIYKPLNTAPTRQSFFDAMWGVFKSFSFSLGESSSSAQAPAENVQQLISSTSSSQSSQLKALATPADTINKIDDLLYLLNNINPNHNILFIVQDEQSIRQLREFLLSLAPITTTIIDTPKDLNSTSKYLSVALPTSSWSIQEPRGTGGWLKNRLGKTGAERVKRIVFNWSSFTVSQAVKVNTAIESSNRSIDGILLDESIQGIGLITKNHPLMKDGSFKRRYQDNTWTLNLELPTTNQTVTVDDSLIVDLYHSAQWKSILIGKLIFTQGEPHFKPGALPLSLTQTLILRHPPKSSEDFERCIQDLRCGHEIKYYDISVQFPKFHIVIEQSQHFTADQSKIALTQHNVSYDDLKELVIDQVLTPSTFERALVSNEISPEGLLLSSPGWLDNGACSFFITQTLSEEQFAYLLAHAKSPLKLYYARKADTQPVHSATQQNLLSQETIILDVSELSPDDLFYGYEYSINRDNRFIFKETVSEVWQALLSGQEVCLKGYFSPELVDHLATLMLPKGYLWHRGQKVYFQGKLTLMPSNEVKALNWCNNLLLPYVETQPEVKASTQVITEESERVPALFSCLQTYPNVFIEGEPGIGKSYLIRQLLNNTNIVCFTLNALDQLGLEAWAKSSDPRMTLLLIDEATSRGTDWTFLNSNRILVNGKLYKRSDNKKIVFLGNRLPIMPAIFDQNFPTLQVTKLSDQVILDQILKPIFKVIGRESEAEIFYTQHKDHYSLRALQDEALSVCAAQSQAGILIKDKSNRYHLTQSRKPVLNNLLNILAIRHFKRRASVDLEIVRFGGKPGCWLEGPPGAGKTEMIRLALTCAEYQIKEVEALYTDTPATQTRTAYHVPASCDLESLRRHLAYAHKFGLVLWIDELDVLLDPDSASEELIQRLIAELNSYLMGENLNNERPPHAGFTLFATGNGINMDGRAPLPSSLFSRLYPHQIEVYPKSECLEILFRDKPQLERLYREHKDLQHKIDSKIQEYHQDPKNYAFSSFLNEKYWTTWPKVNERVSFDAVQ